MFRAKACSGLKGKARHISKFQCLKKCQADCWWRRGSRALGLDQGVSASSRWPFNRPAARLARERLGAPRGRLSKQQGWAARGKGIGAPRGRLSKQRGRVARGEGCIRGEVIAGGNRAAARPMQGSSSQQHPRPAPHCPSPSLPYLPKVKTS